MATICVIYRKRQFAKQYNIKEVTALLRAQILLEEYHANTDGCDIEVLHCYQAC